VRKKAAEFNQAAERLRGLWVCAQQPLSIGFECAQAPELLRRTSPSRRHPRHFDSLLTTKNSRLMAGKQAPRGDRPNLMHRAHDAACRSRRSPL